MPSGSLYRMLDEDTWSLIQRGKLEVYVLDNGKVCIKDPSTADTGVGKSIFLAHQKLVKAKS